MAHLQLGSSNAQVEHSNTAILRAAKQIAQCCNAAVIGIVVGQQTQIIYGKGYALLDFLTAQDYLEEKIVAKAFKLDSMLIGWKDTRQARRAILDALTLLKLATQVTVLEILENDDKKESVKRLNEP